MQGAPVGFFNDVRIVAAEVFALTGIDVQVSPAAAPVPDGVTAVDISWDAAGVPPSREKALAWASRAILEPVVLTTQITFTRLAHGKSNQMLKNILRHEVGHVLGLSHTPGGMPSTMSTKVYQLNILETRGESPWTADVRRDLSTTYGKCLEV